MCERGRSKRGRGCLDGRGSVRMKGENRDWAAFLAGASRPHMGGQRAASVSCSSETPTSQSCACKSAVCTEVNQSTL